MKANKSANGSMVETRFQKPRAGRHGDKGEKDASSLDESGLLMEVIFGAESGPKRGSEQRSEAPFAGLGTA
jgi:hypothetical protein